jgi:hypothetical protein
MALGRARVEVPPPHYTQGELNARPSWTWFLAAHRSLSGVARIDLGPINCPSKNLKDPCKTNGTSSPSSRNIVSSHELGSVMRDDEDPGTLEMKLPRKRGRPPKHGVAMTEAQRASSHRQ